MKKWQWIILAVIAYLVFLIAYMPAVYLSDYIQKQSQNKVSLSGVSGTLFEGESLFVTYDGMRIDNVKWSLSPWSLLLLQANVDMTGGSVRATERISLNGNLSVPFYNTKKLTLSDTRIFLPAKPIFAELNLGVPVTANGRFRIDISELTINNGCQSLSGTGNWLQASVNVLNNPLDLGNFDAALSCETPSFALQIAPSNGLELDAKILIDTQGKYSATGQFRIPDNYPNEIKQGASIFGNANEQGVYELNL